MHDFLTKLAQEPADMAELVKGVKKQTPTGALLKALDKTLKRYINRATTSDESPLLTPEDLEYAARAVGLPASGSEDFRYSYDWPVVSPDIESGPKETDFADLLPSDVGGAAAYGLSPEVLSTANVPPSSPPPAEPSLLDRILGWPRARWDVLVQAFKQNPVLASALAAAGPTALLGGAYGTYRAAKNRNLLRSLLFGALSGAGGGALYRPLSAPVEGLSSLWLPLAIGALIGAGGGAGAYGLGRLFG